MRIVLEHGETLHDDVHPIGVIGEPAIPYLEHGLQCRIILRDLLIGIILTLYTARAAVNNNRRAVKFELLVILTIRKERKGQ